MESTMKVDGGRSTMCQAGVDLASFYVPSMPFMLLPASRPSQEIRL